MLAFKRLFLYSLLVVTFCWSVIGQSTEFPTTNCPDIFEVSSYCNCSDLSPSFLILDCSDAQSEEHLEEVFASSSFPEGFGYALLIRNNQRLKYLSRNVFGTVTFQTIHFVNDAIEYIDEGVFLNSNSTLEIWVVNFCNLLPEGFPFSSLGSYGNLNTLHLESAGTFDLIPRLVSDSIQYLHVLSCQTTYLHAEAFSAMPNLTYLYLTSNRISALPAGIFDNNPLMYSIYLTNNNIEQLVYGTFRNLENLAGIELGYNKISHIEPGAFYNLPKLRMLYLHFNSVPYFLFEYLGNLPLLKDLGLYNNGIQYLDPDLLLGCPTLRGVYADYNNITYIAPGTFDALKTGFLMLNYNSLTTLDEGWLYSVLDNMNQVDIDSNPLECGCDMAWLFTTPSLMTNLVASCSNGTDIHDLDPSFFENNC